MFSSAEIFSLSNAKSFSNAQSFVDTILREKTLSLRANGIKESLQRGKCEVNSETPVPSPAKSETVLLSRRHGEQTRSRRQSL
jgi:hypothetical protein